ncbi:hypothetical protein Ddye_015996 [Dipteronia dyeriana]|uniref:Reverse transcriptase domain-containing protein n=1 Tax=Dipteronia dyeriana TaxID=168575 RepID=A0AAD9U6F7_9ROSI|nr:hypothetical protein Ddye_015996 [Dipteronia dyeriana]
MKTEVVQHFKDLFMERHSFGLYYHLPMFFLTISEAELARLLLAVDETKLKNSLFSIGGLKAPRLEGFPSIFFQKFWNVCKGDLMDLVLDCFTKGCVPSLLNNTLISLIPKIPNPTTLSHFRPISLCNTTYKLISKIRVQRLRGLLPKLVNPNQVAFVPGRQIQDNIIVAQQVLNKFRIAKGINGLISWKIDLSKAYDKIQWSFIKLVLEEQGIVGDLNNLIMSCVFHNKVILNGEMTDNFTPKCDIKQGDPISPYIFVLFMEKLSHIIHQKLLDGRRG